MENSQQRTFLEYALSVFVLVITLLYGYGYNQTVSYPGFDFSIENSTIIRVSATDSASQELRPGDKLLQVNAVPFKPI